MRRAVFDKEISDADSSKAHAGLWLDRFIRENDGSEDERERQPKTELVRQVAGINVRAEYKKFYERWQQTLEASGAQCREARADHCRMAVGLGAESALETSIALHHTYGVPFIPGSALKGLAASFARHRLEGDEWRKDGTHYATLFGDMQSAGFITFYDALLRPTKDQSCPLHSDVLTVHHRDYYGSGSAPPADWDSPNPVSFLSATGRGGVSRIV